MRFARNEALRYLGVKGEADDAVVTLLSRAEAALESAASPRHALLRIPLSVEGGRIQTPFFTADSPALAKHLAEAKEAYLFAATLGAEVDRLMNRYTKLDMAFALALQACAASALECYADDISSELSRALAAEGLFLLPRFSPGYSGFSIEYQTDFLAALSADRRIGLSETASHMLTPLKSITALIGITPKQQPCSTHKCASCPNTGCAYRKEP